MFGSASVLIVVGLVRLETLGRIAPRNFSIQTGGASYAIYLSHIPILVVSQHLGLPRILDGRPFGIVAAVYCILMLFILAISVIHYRKLERPLHQLFKRWLGIHRPGSSEQSVPVS